MKRTLTFAKRNIKELSRDPLSYIFCVAFPIVMLVVMTVVNESIPAGMGPTTFVIDNLAGGIIIFGHTFIMLFTAILVATDRSTSFLMRQFSSPMKGRDFTNGYIIPMLIIAVAQCVLAVASSLVIASVTGSTLKPLGLLLVVAAQLPSSLMFISIGLIFGSILNEKSAPGVCSVIISLGSFLGGIFFDAEGVGGVIYKLCKFMPFIYCTRLTRSSIKLDFSWETFGSSLVIVAACAAVCTFLATLTFKQNMRTDK